LSLGGGGTYVEVRIDPQHSRKDAHGLALARPIPKSVAADVELLQRVVALQTLKHVASPLFAESIEPYIHVQKA